MGHLRVQKEAESIVRSSQKTRVAWKKVPMLTRKGCPPAGAGSRSVQPARAGGGRAAS